MFTGLIECIGTINSVEQSGTSSIIAIKPDLSDFRVPCGASVSIDGSCLTVENDNGSLLYFSAVRETLQRTTLSTVQVGRRVNMERALQIGGRLDGHLVLGHVDGVGTIISDRDVRGSILRTIEVPAELSRFIAEKGSVSIDGISLTIAKSQENLIVISFIPATVQKTTMALKRSGDKVNVECDVLARYLNRLMAQESKGMLRDSLLTKMERLGF